MRGREAISNGRTFDYEETIKLTTGNMLWSNRSKPLLEIVEDSVGVHDFLLTPCSADTFRHFYPDKPEHRGCFGNLVEALAPYGIDADALPYAFNLFMNVPVEATSGRVSVLPPVTKSGDYIRLRALTDLVVGLTACSAYASNGGTFKPIDYRVDPGELDAPGFRPLAATAAGGRRF
ncbi:MAG: urea carboxylase-associated family protein [Sphingopyxis sp.]|nr:urea carboxylase-associated family protein [Sphingopyxis sp.]